MATKRKPLKSLAAKAFKEQSGCCIYCDKPMWLDDLDSFRKRYHIDPAELELYRCTGEHLIPHSLGGKANRRNIAAAHWYCNCQRHAKGRNPGPLEYREIVQREVTNKTWPLFHKQRGVGR